MTENMDKFSRPGEVFVSEGDDNFVLLDYENGFYYGLDELGKKIYTLLENRKSVSEIVEELSVEYEVSKDILKNDVTRFIEQLLKAKLIKAGS
ncbi:PqqD family protein [Rossellomorea aquimaris]|uniref:PqqD family protein n=1 Tax=Rossellomorea aquimaris TaxID=189382 RepID=UPI0037C8A2E4